MPRVLPKISPTLGPFTMSQLKIDEEDLMSSCFQATDTRNTTNTNLRVVVVILDRLITTKYWIDWKFFIQNTHYAKNMCVMLANLFSYKYYV